MQSKLVHNEEDLGPPATSKTEHFMAMANNFSCNSRIRQITVRAFVCA